MQKFLPYGCKIVALFAAIGFVMLSAAHAAAPELTAQERADLKRVEAYLNNIKTMQSEFTQIDPSGNAASGSIALQRPGGRMRWKYNPPMPIWMLSTGEFLIYVDEELEQVSYIPIDQTLAAFLARDMIRFEGDISVMSVQKGAGTLRVSIRLTNDPDQGALALEFEDKPLKLKNIYMTDQLGQVTSIALENPRFGEPIPTDVLKFVDPSKKWGRRVKR